MSDEHPSQRQRTRPVSTSRLRPAVGAAVLAASTLAAAVAAAAGCSRPTAAGLTPSQADEMVRAHNGWRQRAGVPPIGWATDLAARAQSRATYLAAHGCVLEHGCLPQDVGENQYRAGSWRTYGAADQPLLVTPTQVVEAWGAESSDCSVLQDTAARTRRCGHYSQIVWAATDTIGCGMAICPTHGQIWVCNYRPRGNVRTR